MTQQVLTESSRIKYPWLLGQQQDLLFFIAPAIVASVIYALTVVYPWLSAVTLLFTLLYAVNVLHQAATYFHYCDSRNRNYYFGTAKQRLKFIVLPIALLVMSIGVGLFYFQLVIAVWLFWGVPHVVQQNTGILLLYHNQRSGEAIVPRSLEILTLRLSALFFFALMFYRGWFQSSGLVALNPYYLALLAILLIAFVTSILMYLVNLGKQVKNGAILNAPALFFWGVCVTFYMPVAFTGNSLALLVPSVLHWLQYIGLNYVMVQRKYSGEQAHFLSIVAAERPADTKTPGMRFFALFCLGVLVVQYGLYILFLTLWPQANYMNVWNSAFLGLGMVHYLLDGFIWKFREEHNRKAILPYLVSRS